MGESSAPGRPQSAAGGGETGPHPPCGAYEPGRGSWGFQWGEDIAALVPLFVGLGGGGEDGRHPSNLRDSETMTHRDRERMRHGSSRPGPLAGAAPVPPFPTARRRTARADRATRNAVGGGRRPPPNPYRRCHMPL